MVQTGLQTPATRRVVYGLAITAQMLALLVTGIWIRDFLQIYVPRGYFDWFPWAALALLCLLCSIGAWLLLFRLHSSVRQFIWVTQGMLIGSIAVGAWSLGPSFFPSWLLLTVAAIIDRITSRKGLSGLAAIGLLIAAAVIQFNLVIALSIATRPTPTMPPLPSP